MDRDEGFWLYTSWRVAEGELPYRDFALPHLPIASLYYAGAIKIFGPSLYALRGVNVALFLVAGAALAFAVKRRFGAEAAFFAAVLYGSSSLTLTWLVPIKAYAPAAAALTLAVALALGGPKSDGSFPRAAIIGFLLGLATMARLPLVVTLAAAAFGAWFAAPPGAFFGRRLGGVAASCAGFLAAVVPLALYFRGAAGDAFTFNVVGVHKLFLNEPAAGRVRAVLGLLWPPDPAVLVLLSLVGVRRDNIRRLLFPLGAAVLVLLADVIPGSSQLQYFVVAVPAFAPAAALGAVALGRRRKEAAVIVIALTAAFGAARPASKVVFDRAHKDMVGPAEVYAAADILAKNTSPADVVFAAWPGYAALAHRRVIPGWELGYFTDRVGSRLDAGARRRYRLATYDETAAALAQGRATFALDGMDTPAPLRRTLIKFFEPIAESRGVKLYRFRTPPAAAIKN